MSNDDATVIFAEWDPDEPTIIVRIENKMLDLPEWQAYRDCFDELDKRQTQGLRTSDDRVQLINFRAPPALESVQLCFAQIKQHMEFKGFPDHEAKWNTTSVFKDSKRFKDPENVELETNLAEKVGMKPRDIKAQVEAVDGLIETANTVVTSVGTGQLSLREGYAALLLAIEELEG